MRRCLTFLVLLVLFTFSLTSVSFAANDPSNHNQFAKKHKAERLDTPECPYLSNCLATWAPVDNENNGYRIRLFLNEEKIAMVTLAHGEALSYDFTPLIISPGSYTVRVKALANGDYKDSKESRHSQAQIIGSEIQAPAAPTEPVIDDTANTFGWTFVPGYSDISQYEYCTDSGATWEPCTANPQLVGNNSYAAGVVLVRIKEDTSSGVPAGDTLASNAPFTTYVIIEGNIILLAALTGDNNGRISIGYTKSGTFYLEPYAVASTTEITINGQTAGFADLMSNDKVKITLDSGLMLKLEVAR